MHIHIFRVLQVGDTARLSALGPQVWRLQAIVRSEYRRAASLNGGVGKLAASTEKL